MTESHSWARIMAPVAGGDADGPLLAAAALLAAPFGAELAAVYAPADVAEGRARLRAERCRYSAPARWRRGVRR